MAKTDNLTDFMVDLADGIRAKKGTTEPINPQDFRKEIESISGGGSGGGDNQVTYLNIMPFKDVAGDMLGSALKMVPGLLAVKTVKDWVTICPLSALQESYISDIIYVAILSNFRGFIEQTNDLNSSTIIATLIEQGAVEITAEEFYKLD